MVVVKTVDGEINPLQLLGEANQEWEKVLAETTIQRPELISARLATAAHEQDIAVGIIRKLNRRNNL